MKAELKKGNFTEIKLQNALYLLNIDINIIFRHKHYRAGGCVRKETLHIPSMQPCGVLNVAK